MDLITQAEYARHRGVSREAVRRAVVSGRIALVGGKVDRADADRRWGALTRPQAGGNPPTSAPPPTSVPPLVDGTGRGVPEFHAERARRERAEADLAEMKAAELAKSLIRVDEVRRQWSAIASEVRTALLQIPARVAPVLAQRDVAFVRHTLDLEIRQSLEKLVGEGG